MKTLKDLVFQGKNGAVEVYCKVVSVKRDVNGNKKVKAFYFIVSAGEIVCINQTLGALLDYRILTNSAITVNSLDEPVVRLNLKSQTAGYETVFILQQI